MKSKTLVLLSFLIAFALLISAPAWGQEIRKEQMSPEAVTRASFDALVQKDIPAYVSLVHPDELTRFKKLVIDLFSYFDPDESIENTRRVFAPLETVEEIAATDASDLLTIWIQKGLVPIDDIADALAQTKIRVLGEVEEETNLVHVIVQAIMPKPAPLSCQKNDDCWHLLLSDEMIEQFSDFEFRKYLRLNNLGEPPKRMSIEKIDFIGKVNDGDDMAYALCRSTLQHQDYSTFVFRCYAIRKGEPAWELLEDPDKTKFTEALRAKWRQ